MIYAYINDVVPGLFEGVKANVLIIPVRGRFGGYPIHHRPKDKKVIQALKELTKVHKKLNKSLFHRGDFYWTGDLSELEEILKKTNI